jgi:hypothetical protein
MFDCWQSMDVSYVPSRADADEIVLACSRHTTFDPGPPTTKARQTERAPWR